MDPITTLTATEIAALVRTEDLSAVEVTDAHIGRIEETDGRLNAVVIPLFDEARAAAADADAAQGRGAPLGPLHGVPITIKEQFRVAGTQTTLGASERIGNVFHDEGPLVTALRGAGAIVLGKTNIMQTLAGWETDNPVYGRTNNPWDLDRSPGGSSGGEAAVIAAGGSAMGLGGDLGGSIRLPAHFCGVHGFKPTSGRLSNDDFAPGLLSSGQEVFIPQPGPLARSVADLQLAMAVLAETSMQPTRDVVPPVPWPDPTRVACGDLRIGVYDDNGYFDVSPSVRRAVAEAAEALRRLGAVVEPIRPPSAEEGVRLFLGAASAAGSADIIRLLGEEDPVGQLTGLLRGARLPAPLRPLVATVMERRGQDHVARQIRAMGRCSAGRYQELVEARNDYRAAFVATLNEGRFDAVICPPVALPAFTHGSSEHLFPAVSYALTYNVLGTPAGVVPVTTVRSDEESDRRRTDDMADIAAATVEAGSAGLPVGVQVVARHWHDDVVLAVMAAIEEQCRTSPEFPGRCENPS